MNKRELFDGIYNPPFYLHKINNYQKAVYERKGHWTEKEKVKYGVFLEIFRDKFENRQNPVLNKMFRVMSDFIKTRNHNQCRSHHQKMERERFQIDSILESIRSKYHPREYELFYQKYTRHIKALNTEAVLNEKGFTPHKNILKRRKQQLKNAKKEMKETISINKQLPKQCQEMNSMKMSKIENNQNDLEFNKRKEKVEQIKITVDKQTLIRIEGTKNNYEERNILPIVKKIQAVQEKQIQLKKSEDNKKTALDYDYDSDSDIKYQQQKIAFIDIPAQVKFLNQKDKQIQRLNLSMPAQYLHHSDHQSVHLSIPSFGGFPNFQPQCGQQFPMCSTALGYGENYGHSIEQLDERKKWHLSEANRLCTEMNQHFQQASMCDQMRQAMKQIIEMGRGYFYPGQFASPQY